jgi:hypothetical protein
VIGGSDKSHGEITCMTDILVSAACMDWKESHNKIIFDFATVRLYGSFNAMARSIVSIFWSANNTLRKRERVTRNWRRPILRRCINALTRS